MARSKKVLSEQYMLKALQLKKDKNYEKSVKYFKKTIALKIKLPADFYFEYGETAFIHLNTENHLSKTVGYKEAINAFDKFVTLKKEKDETYMKALDYLNKLDEVKEIVDKCKKGNGKACNRLAISFTKDGSDEELELYKKSCNLNYGIGCQNVGYIYQKQKNIKKAKEYYKKGCDLKDENSCTYLKELNK